MIMIQTVCAKCQLHFERKSSDVNKSKKQNKNIFCSKKCAGIFNSHIAKKYDQKEIQQMIDMYTSGLSTIQISKIINAPKDSIVKILKKNGIVMRPSGFKIGNKASSGRVPTVEEMDRRAIAMKKAGKIVNDPIGIMIRNYSYSAAKRNYVFNLNRKEFENFIFSNCYYCNEVPAKRKIQQYFLVCNGIDRIDNTIGYTIDNCVSCCSKCNRMKIKMNKEDFINQCVKIATKQNRLTIE